MRRSVSIAVLVWAALVPAMLFGDDAPASKAIRIGVPMVRNSSRRVVATRVQRERLLQMLNGVNRKKDRSQGKTAIEAVALDADSGEARSAAKDKDCDYILYTDVVDLRERGDPAPQTMPGRVVIGDPAAAPGGDLTKSTYGEVEFKLVRVGDPEPMVETSVSGREDDDEDTTVTRLLDRVVSRVVSEVRKAHPPAH